MRAAASSRASGSPSSRAQMPAIGRGVGRGQGETGPKRLSAGDEELHAGVFGQVRRRGRHRRIGNGQGFDGELLLPLQTEPGAARDQEREPGRGGQQIGEHQGGVRKMLGVVEDQQEALVAQIRDQRGHDRRPASLRRLQGLRNRRRHEAGIGNGSQRHEADAIGVPFGKVRGDPDSQPRLADAAWTGQRHEPSRLLPKESADRLNLPRTAVERRQRLGQPDGGAPFDQRDKGDRWATGGFWMRGHGSAGVVGGGKRRCR